jgi:hypothetical protein
MLGRVPAHLISRADSAPHSPSLLSFSSRLGSPPRHDCRSPKPPSRRPTLLGCPASKSPLTSIAPIARPLASRATVCGLLPGLEYLLLLEMYARGDKRQRAGLSECERGTYMQGKCASNLSLRDKRLRDYLRGKKSFYELTSVRALPAQPCGQRKFNVQQLPPLTYLCFPSGLPLSILQLPLCYFRSSPCSLTPERTSRVYTQ